MRFRELAVTLLLVGMLGTLALADEDTGDSYGGGGGPMPSLLFLDLEDLNAVTASAGYPALREVLYLNGGGGYGGAINGVRIGGYGLGGKTEAVRDERSVEFEMNYGGVMVEKAVSTSADLTLVLGSVIGGGRAGLILVNYLPDTFNDAVASPYVSTMTKDFFAVQPYVAFETQPLSWMWTRFQMGFLWTLADAWTFEDAEFAGPPRSIGGIIVQVMLSFGGQGAADGDEPEAPVDAVEPDAD